MKRMTKSQAVAYMRGQRAANRLHTQEVRRASPTERLRNMDFMLGASQNWPWTAEQLAHRATGVTSTRERSRRLREILGG